MLQQLHGIRSGQSTLVLTGLRPTTHLRQQLLQAGASALLTYNAPPATVVATVAGLLSSTTHSINTAPALPRRATPPTPFSQREVEVLRLVMADCCNQEIADKLFLSVRTVESHRRALLQKAGTKTLVGLVVQAVRERWLALT
ncbi:MULTISPECIES: helix-turn-helix transcriptional regulator [Hymenobacter]|nr:MULTISPECIES: LuxR C-terminal-related transcriptional regulator [Hymenobacter]